MNMDITPSVSLPCALLIDLDNCPTQIAHLSQTLELFSRIIICYGGFEPKIPLSQLAPLAPAIVSGRLTIEAMERKGKNAADFGLTFWAGRLVMEMPPETEFLILSQDNDLDYLIDMLRSVGRKVKRADGNSYPNLEIARPNPNNPADISLADVAQDYYKVQISSRRARPARRLTLLNSIRSHIKNEMQIDPDAVLQELIRQNVLSIGNNGQIIYRDRLSPSAIADSVAKDINCNSTGANSIELTGVNSVPNEISSAPQSDKIKNFTDEYYLVHIVNHRTRPLRRTALLNSISSHFKGQPTVDPNAIMAELFRRGLVAQNQNGVLHYHKQPTPSILESPPEPPPKVINTPAVDPITEVASGQVAVIKQEISEPMQDKLAEIAQQSVSAISPAASESPAPAEDNLASATKSPAKTKKTTVKKVAPEKNLASSGKSTEPVVAKPKPKKKSAGKSSIKETTLHPLGNNGSPIQEIATNVNSGTDEK